MSEMVEAPENTYKKCHFVPVPIPGRDEPAMHFKPCKTLHEQAPDSYSHAKKGLGMMDNMMHFDSGVVWNYGATYRKQANKKGLVLNYCPWCGERIDNPEARPKNLGLIEVKS